jgi:polysaccharide deacetylase 2 family uncharacterized protein YibQ
MKKATQQVKKALIKFPLSYQSFQKVESMEIVMKNKRKDEYSQVYQAKKTRIGRFYKLINPFIA